MSHTQQLDWPECTLFAIIKAVRERCKEDNLLVPAGELKGQLKAHARKRARERREEQKRKQKVASINSNFDSDSDSEDDSDIPGATEGYHVQDFDQCYLYFQNQLTGRNEQCDITILVESPEIDEMDNDCEYVLVDIREPPNPDHCLYVVYKFKEKNNTYFLCRDGKQLGKRNKRYPIVPVKGTGPVLFKVRICVDRRISIQSRKKKNCSMQIYKKQ